VCAAVMGSPERLRVTSRGLGLGSMLPGGPPRHTGGLTWVVAGMSEVAGV